MDVEYGQVASKIGKEFIRSNHYSRSCHNGPMTFGAWIGNDLVGVIAFATPCSENVRASVYGIDRKNEVTELHRMFVTDEFRESGETLTRFISKSIKWLAGYKPVVTAIITFADSTEGHTGGIYKAANFIPCGTTGRARFWRDQEGRLRHPRQNGVNITPVMASDRGWKPEMRDGKYRFITFIGSGRAKRRLMGECKLLKDAS